MTGPLQGQKERVSVSLFAVACAYLFMDFESAMLLVTDAIQALMFSEHMVTAPERLTLCYSNYCVTFSS